MHRDEDGDMPLMIAGLVDYSCWIAGM
jgi:hypothetical protein